MSKQTFWARLQELRGWLEEQAERLLWLGIPERDVYGELLELLGESIEVVSDRLDDALPLDQLVPGTLGEVLEEYDDALIEYVLERVVSAAKRRRQRGRRRTLVDLWRARQQRTASETQAAAPAETIAPAAEDGVVAPRP